MLRNNLKIAICGLTSLFLVFGCSSTKPLLENDCNFIVKNNISIKFKSDPYYEYKIRNIINSEINAYSCDISFYNINIEIKDKESEAVFSEKNLIKEQKRIAAKIEIYDKKYNKLFETVIDSFSTYELHNNHPYAGLSSKKSATEFMLTDIGNNIAISIISFAKSKKFKL